MKLSYEEPSLKKCCCIIPIRAGLVTFAIFKILADLVGYAVFQYLGLACIALCTSVDKYDMGSYVLIALALILDISFMVILIVGVCKISNPLYRLSYYYSILSLVLAVGSIALNIVITYTKDGTDTDKEIFSDELSYTENFFIYVGITTVYTLIHIYMILLMKSEMIKTQNLSDDRESIIKINCERNVSSKGRFL